MICWGKASSFLDEAVKTWVIIGNLLWINLDEIKLHLSMFYKNQVKRQMTNALCHSVWGKVLHKTRIITSSKYWAQAKLFFFFLVKKKSKRKITKFSFVIPDTTSSPEGNGWSCTWHSMTGDTASFNNTLAAITQCFAIVFIKSAQLLWTRR